MFKQPYNKSGSTYSFMYRHGIPSFEIDKRQTSLRNQAQVFSTALQRLLTPKETDEPHNFIPDYRRYDLYGHPLALEKRLPERTRPFHGIRPNLLASAFKTGKTNNLGALLFINLLTDTPFSETALHLAQSSLTKKYYFTQLPSPSWLAFFDNSIVTFSFEEADIHNRLRAAITSSLIGTHTEWWIDSGLLKTGDSGLYINYEDILLEEILITMFRLYLTPMPVIDYLLDHSFNPTTGGAQFVAALKANIRATISGFQNSFLNHILPTIVSDDMEEKLFKLYTNYVTDLHQFTIFPFPAIQSHFADKILNDIKCEILKRAIETKYTSTSFLKRAFDEYMELTNTYFFDMLVNDRHFLWRTLNRLSENLARQETSNYEITLNENLHCLLIRSIEFHHTPFAKFILSTFLSRGKLLEISQLPLGEKISSTIYRPLWDKHGLVDVANTVGNDAIKDYLSSAGSAPLIDEAPRYVAISPYSMFLKEQSELNQRPRTKSYSDLSGFFCPV